MADSILNRTKYHLPVQGVSVEYLPENQKLQIPAAMGMSWSPTTDHTKLCETNRTLYSRFWKVASMSYTEIDALVKTKTTPPEVREVINGLEMMTPVSEKPKWSETEGDADFTFGKLSRALQFNCDIRDFGYLLTENATVTDFAWSNNVENVPRTRINNHLKPYTLHMIAALNNGPVGNYPLGAWVRACGLGFGIYPAQNSAFNVEAVYTIKMPSLEDYNVTGAFNRSHGEFLMTICGNILAVFGLLHLNKNHTYISGNESMNQFGMFYLETIQASAVQKMLEDLMTTKHKECILRIAPHPFGLAQTFWLAKVLYKHKLLLPALAVRCEDVTPPPVQRIRVILRAAGEWYNLPAGRQVLRTFSDKLARLKIQEVAIKAASPRYSELYRFYGCGEKMEISGEIWNDVQALMPVTYGYAMAFHVTEDGKNRDGIALARCLMSVERDTKIAGLVWKNAWIKSFEDMTNPINLTRR